MGKDKKRPGGTEMAAKGGRARAKKLSASQRTEIAKSAAEARWAQHAGLAIPRALKTGKLEINGLKFDCAVLDDNDHTRVIAETNFMETMGMYRSGALSTRRVRGSSGAQIPLSLAHKNLKPYIDKHLGDVHSFAPLRYRTPEGRLVTVGLAAPVIPKVCEVWIDADRDGKFEKFPRQKAIARQADILLRGLAHVGIIALVDEATGWQEDRARLALATILEAFVATELRKWVRTFPMEYFRELCRLRDVPFPEGASLRLPPYFGRLTNNLVYARLAPGVLAELQTKNPTIRPGYRRHKNFQWLTEDLGDPKLRAHLWALVGLMRAFDDWDSFYARLEQKMPKYSDRPLLAIIEEWDTNPSSEPQPPSGQSPSGEQD
jgi:hypothetical protein